MPNYYLAIDIGASSGRHIIGWLEEGKLILEEVYRFENRQIHRNGHDCWDTENLWNGIIGGLKACKEKNMIPLSVGIDTWGVDYVLLDGQDRLVGDAVAYRDARTEGMDLLVGNCISPEALYERTGIQKASYNTIYQLMALKQEYPEQLEQAEYLMMTPDYYNFRLTGIKKNEYTIASTSNLVNAESKQWDMSVISAMGFPAKLFHELSMPGTIVGGFSPEIVGAVGFDATVILPAAHDTGSAFLAIPAVDENAVYISSGTWSLLGVENDHPVTTLESYKQNFTNEGGAWGRYRYLKNIMGLWIIQSIRRELNGVVYVQGRQSKTEAVRKWSFPDLIEEAKKAEGFPSVVDVNKECFLSPTSMIHELKEECRRTEQPIPETTAELMQCVYSSLVICYRNAIDEMETLTGKKYTSINIVGGGCQDAYLNQRTVNATGLPVLAGPVEGTAIGNLMLQMICAEELTDLQAARDVIRNSFSIAVYKP